MIKRWGKMSKWAKFCFISSLIFLVVGLVWLIYDLSTGGFTIWSPTRSFIIVGIVLFLSMLSENDNNNNNSINKE